MYLIGYIAIINTFATTQCHNNYRLGVIWIYCQSSSYNNNDNRKLYTLKTVITVEIKNLITLLNVQAVFKSLTNC